MKLRKIIREANESYRPKVTRRVYPLGRPGRSTNQSDKEFAEMNREFDRIQEEKRAEECTELWETFDSNRVYNAGELKKLREYPDEHPCPECGTVWPVELVICEKCGMDIHKSWMLVPEEAKVISPWDGVDLGYHLDGMGRKKHNEEDTIQYKIEQIIKSAKKKGQVSDSWGYRNRVSREVRN